MRREGGPPLPGAPPEDVHHQQDHHEEVQDQPDGEDVVPLGGGHPLPQGIGYV